VFEDTDTDTWFWPDDGTTHCDTPVDTVGAAPGCDTDTFAVCTVAPVVVVNVTTAGRESTVAFADAVNVTDPFPVPVPGDTVNHD